MWIHWVPLVAIVLYTITRVVVNLFDRPGSMIDRGSDSALSGPRPMTPSMP